MNPLKQAILDFCDSNSLSSPADFSLEVLSVRSVDVGNRSCVLYDINGNEFKNIRVQFVGASSFLLPAPDSLVIAFVSRQLSLGYILSTSVIVSAEVVIGDNSAIIDADGCRIDTAKMSAHINKEDIIFNGGGLNGLVIIDDLTTRLNIIEKDINNLKKVFASGWVPTPQDGGAALKTAAASWSGATLTETKRSDYENTKIKQ